MAQRVLEGFDLWSIVPSQPVSGAFTPNKWYALNSNPQPALTSTVAYADSPAKSIQFTPALGSTQQGYLWLDLNGSPVTELIFGFNFMYTGSWSAGTSPGGTNGICSFSGIDAVSGLNKVVLEVGVDSSGVLHITDGFQSVGGTSGTTYASGTTALIPGFWYHIDFQANYNASIGANTCFIKLNAAVEANVPTSSDTITTHYTVTSLDRVGIGFLTAGVITLKPVVYFDDTYLYDLTGGSANAPVGFEKIHSVAPSTLTLVTEGAWEYGATSNIGTFTGTAASAAKRASSVSSTATFTGAATGGIARAASASSSATFSYSAASTPALPSGRVAWIGSRLSQLGNITPGQGLTRGRFIVASASDSFKGMSSPLDTRITTHVVLATAGAVFTGTGSSTHHLSGSASDTATFNDQVVTKGHFTHAADTASFSDVASSPASRGKASDSFKFTDLALSGKNKSVSAASSATFTGTARESKPTVFSQHVSDSFVFLVTYASVHDTSMPCSASDSATFSDDSEAGGQFGLKSPASDIATYTELATVKFRRVFRPVIVSAARFTDTAKSTALHLFNLQVQAAATFSDRASTVTLHVFPTGISDSASFTDVASAPALRVPSASDSATFTGLAVGARAVTASATNTVTVSGTAGSNHFFAVSASSSATFTGTTTSTVEHLGATDRGTFSDGAGVSVLLPSGLTVPGGDQSAGLRQVLYSPLSREFPLSFAESPEGILFAANGVDAPIAWDGYSANAWAAGVTAPDQVVWMDGSGSGSILGRRWAYLRYVDVRGNYSNLSQISDPVDLGRDAFIDNASYSSSGVVTITSFDHRLSTGQTIAITGVLGLETLNGQWVITVIDDHTFTLNGLVQTSGQYISSGVWTMGAATVNYSHVEVPTDPKIVRRQILRNLAGDASVFYVDIDTTDLASTTFSSGQTDEQLATQQPVPVLWTNRENAVDRLFQGDSPAAMRFGLPPSWKCAVAAYAGRIFAAADVVYSSGAIQASLGSPYVLGLGTGFTTAFTGRLLYVNGSGQPPAVIQSVMVPQQILVLQSSYSGASVLNGQYSIRPAPVERSLVYYSEPHLPEAWPSWNAFSVPETDDEITGLQVFKSFLFILKERNVFKLAYKNDPGRDGYVFPCVRRGCVNNRCAVYVDDSVYMLDEMGVHKFDGDTTEPISQAIDSIFKPDGTSSYQVDWTAQRTLWHASHDQVQHLVRWHVDFVGFPSLEYAICFDYRLNQWWLESYAERVSSSCLGIVSGYRRSTLGTTARRVMCAGLGSLDGVQESVNGTLSGMVASGDTLTLTDDTANFPPNLAGVPVVLAAGTGSGQTAVVSSNTSTTLSLVRPLDIAPDTTTSYQIGGVAWTWKSSWRRIEEDEEENPRDLELVWRPTKADASMTAELFYDHSSEPYSWGYDLDRDGISVRAAAPGLVFDLSTPRGYAIQRLSGHRDPYGYGYHYIAVQLSGAQGANQTTVYQVLLDGTE